MQGSKVGAYAVEQRWTEIQEILLAELGAMSGQARATLLCELCFYGNERCIHILLDAESDANFRFEYRGRSDTAYRVVAYPRTTPIGQTILGQSQGRFHTLSVLRLLLQSKADPNRHTYQGYTPLQLAIIQNLPEHAETLFRAGADPHIVCEDPLIPEGDAFYFIDQYGQDRAWARALLRT